MKKAAPLAILLALAACDQTAGVGGRGDASPDRGNVMVDLGAPSQWAVPAGGPGEDHAVMAVDRGRNELVLAGSFVGTAGFGSIAMASTGTGLFVVRLDAAGRFLWGLPIILAATTTEVRLAVDEEGNSFVTAGGFSGSASAGPIECAAAGTADVLVVKVDRRGAAVWARALGGAASQMSFTQAIGVDGADGPVLAGSFHGTADLGGVLLTAVGESDLYVARLRSDGSTDWAVPAGGPRADRCGASFVGGGSITIAGQLGEGEARFGELVREVKDGRQIFVAELSPAGSWRWVETSIGTAPVRGMIDALLRDHRGDIYAAGALGEPVVPLVLKVGSTGGLKGAWVFRGAGSVAAEGARGLVIDRSELVVTGWFSATRELDGAFFTPRSEDVFVARLGAEDGTLHSLELAGGAGKERGYSIARDQQGNVYVAGTYTESFALAGTPLQARGGTDLFVWKLPPSSPEP